jgi:hypothetical protein
MTMNLANYGLTMPTTGAKYPSLQATKYKNVDTDTAIDLALNQDSFEKVPEAFQSLFPVKQVTFDKKKGAENFYIVPSDMRWVVMGFPQTCMVNKSDDRDVRFLKKGFKFSENGFKSATRLLLACLTPKGFIEQDGEILFFTLKLTSNRTRLVNDRDAKIRSITNLNLTMAKAKEISHKDSWLHLCSVKLICTVHEWGEGDETNNGVMFTIDGGGKWLPEDKWERMFLLAQSEEVKKFLADPFFLLERDNETAPTPKPQSRGGASADYEDGHSEAPQYNEDF